MKKVIRPHRDKSYAAQNEFLVEMSVLHGDQIVCLDGMHFSKDDNDEKYGYAMIGKDAIILQLHIQGRTFAVHAAMRRIGFIAWEIFERNVDGLDVANFIRERVQPLFEPNDFLLLDNAKNQRTLEVYLALSHNLGGRYHYNVPYSPELNPIEHGFSLVRRWCRQHEHEYPNDPIALINAGFHLYSFRGPLGSRCTNFFDFFDNMHNDFMLY